MRLDVGVYLIISELQKLHTDRPARALNCTQTEISMTDQFTHFVFSFM